MGLYDAISEASDLVSGVTAIASSKKEIILKQGANAVLLFIILVIFGCLDFATLTFHIEYLLTPSFWGTVITKMIAGVCAFNIGINLMLDNEIKKNKVLEGLIKRYYELLEKKQTDFEYYVTKVFNREQKKKSYISHINRKIAILNRLSRGKDRLLYSSDLKENEEKKKKNLYCRKRAELEALKDPDFIEKNIDSIYVRYYEVDPAVFELEIDGSASIKGVKTRGSLVVGRSKASSSIIFSMLGFSMFVTAFTLTADQEQFESQMEAFWHYCLKTAEDVGVILWQAFQGMIRVRKIVSQQLTEPYSGRIMVLEGYLNWRLTNKVPDTALYKERQKEEYIEISESDLKELEAKKKAQ